MTVLEDRVFVSVQVPLGLKAELQRLADEQEHTLSDELRAAIRRHLADPPPPAEQMAR